MLHPSILQHRDEGKKMKTRGYGITYPELSLRTLNKAQVLYAHGIEQTFKTK